MDKIKSFFKLNLNNFSNISSFELDHRCCGICKELKIINPVELKCGHEFCYFCIKSN